MNVRLLATTLILVFVFAFVVALLLLGYALGTALAAAGGAGLVAAEIAHRLLGGPPSRLDDGGARPQLPSA